MADIINSTYITLDGAIEEPQNWPSTGEDSAEHDRIQAELLDACGTLLMGRRTYDVFASAWPTRSGDPVSDKLNAMPKVVVSTTLTDPEWANTTVIGDDPVGAITKLKADASEHIIQYGFGRLSATMVEHRLLDELRLWVHPFFIGETKADDLIAPHCPPASFELVDTNALKSGIVILTYRVAR